MSDEQRFPYSGSGDQLVFVVAGGKQVFYLSNRDAPMMENDRDRHVLRALLQLALERLDYPSMSLTSLKSEVSS